LSNYQVPELAAVADKFAKQDLADFAATRKFFRQAAADLPAYDSNRKLRITDVVMPGYQGEPNVAGRVYAPDDAGEAVPGLIYLFSRGYVVGSSETIDHESRMLADRAGVAVLAVAYRRRGSSGFVNLATLRPDAELAGQMDAFWAAVRRPAVGNALEQLFAAGLQQRGDVEYNLGEWIGKLSCTTTN